MIKTRVAYGLGYVDSSIVCARDAAVVDVAGASVGGSATGGKSDALQLGHV